MSKEIAHEKRNIPRILANSRIELKDKSSKEYTQEIALRKGNASIAMGI